MPKIFITFYRVATTISVSVCGAQRQYFKLLLTIGLLTKIILRKFHSFPYESVALVEKFVRYEKTQKKELLFIVVLFLIGCSNNLFSRTVASQVFSALVSLTTVFGMRTGGTSPLTSPQWYISAFAVNIFFSVHIVHLFLSAVNLFTRQIHNCIRFSFNFFCTS